MNADSPETPTTHPLRAWLDRSTLSDKAFAETVGISSPYLSHLLSGKRGASLALAIRIEAATGGAVPAACLSLSPEITAARREAAASAKPRRRRAQAEAVSP